MKLATDSGPGHRARSRLEEQNFPARREHAADAALKRAELIARLEQANAEPTPPASTPDPITANSVRGLSPMQALDAANGSTLDPLRHRSGGQ